MADALTSETAPALDTTQAAPVAKPARPRLTWINALNVFACISVVILHCSNCFFEGPGSTYYVPSAFVHATFYWPVPVFLMISGATLMGYRDRMTTKEYVQRRWARVGIPFLFWSIFAIVYWYIANDKTFEISHLLNIFVAIERGKANNYYWFFPALFSAYMLIIVLSAINEPLRKRVLIFIAVAGVFYQTMMRTVMPILGFGSSSGWMLPVSGIMLYPVIGYLLFTTDFSLKQRLIIYAVGIAGWLTHLWSLWVLCVDLGHITGIFSTYDNITAITQAAAIFVAFRYMPWDKLVAKFPKFDAIIGWISACSFGVYLIQFFVMDNLGRFFPGVFVGMRLIVWGFIPSYLVSLAIVAIIRKIPILKRIV